MCAERCGAPEFLLEGPKDAPASFLFAHGAGAPMDSVFMNVVSAGLGSLGIRVNTIAPSLFATGLTAGVTDEMATNLTKDAAFPRRLGRPDEYARLAIAMIENPMLNGDTIRLDAGTRFAPK